MKRLKEIVYYERDILSNSHSDRSCKTTRDHRIQSRLRCNLFYHLMIASLHRLMIGTTFQFHWRGSGDHSYNYDLTVDSFWTWRLIYYEVDYWRVSALRGLCAEILVATLVVAIVSLRGISCHSTLPVKSSDFRGLLSTKRFFFLNHSFFYSKD